MKNGYDNLEIEILVPDNSIFDLKDFVSDFRWMCSISHHGGFTDGCDFILPSKKGNKRLCNFLIGDGEIEISFKEFNDEENDFTIFLDVNRIIPMEYIDEIGGKTDMISIKFNISTIAPDRKRFKDIDRILEFVERMISEYYLSYRLLYEYDDGKFLHTNKNSTDMDFVAFKKPTKRIDDDNVYKSILGTHIFNCGVYIPGSYLVYSISEICEIFAKYDKNILELDTSETKSTDIKRRDQIMQIIKEDTKKVPNQYKPRFIIKDQLTRFKIEEIRSKYIRKGVSAYTALSRGDGKITFYMRSILYLQRTDNLFIELLEKSKDKLFKLSGEYEVTLSYDDVMKLDNLSGNTLEERLTKLNNKYSEFDESYIAIL